MANRSTEVTQVADAARTEARRMLAAIAGRTEDDVVRLGVPQFRKLAQLIERLADAGCEGGCMGAPIDGLRFWVPADELAKARAETGRHAAAIAALRQETARTRFSW